MVRPTLTDFNPVELKYYPFMISLDRFSESCNVLSPNNMCEPIKTKIKQWKNIFYNCKCKCNSTTCNSNQK